VDVEKSLLAPRALVAATALLRLDEVHEGLVTGRLRGTLDLYTASETETVTVEGHELPLEREDTATIAVQLARSPLWQWELWGFLGRSPTGTKLPVLLSLDPYRPGRIPVVFVHGTQSSPARWADMANDLLADPWIRQHYQFFFMYETGNPIAYSGMLLRERLTEVLARMDPDGRDPCVHEMVVIGHSQGGLLTKLTAVDTGDRLWNAIFRVPPDQLSGSPEFHALLEKSLFVTPLPFVHRVIFIATPHRGSFLTGEFVNRLVRRLVRLPANVVSLSADTLTKGGDVYADRRAVRKLPTAVDNMTAGNPFLMGLAAIPVAPGMLAHLDAALSTSAAISTNAMLGRTPYRAVTRWTSSSLKKALAAGSESHT
jgi:triacylglycerol esterase/lipase EstA (alpha/beta hydrolase family)